MSTGALIPVRNGAIVFDSWYSGLENLEAVREHTWCFFRRLKSNRLVNPDEKTKRVPLQPIQGHPYVFS